MDCGDGGRNRYQPSLRAAARANREKAGGTQVGLSAFPQWTTFEVEQRREVEAETWNAPSMQMPSHLDRHSAQMSTGDATVGKGVGLLGVVPWTSVSLDRSCKRTLRPSELDLRLDRHRQKNVGKRDSDGAPSQRRACAVRPSAWMVSCEEKVAWFTLPKLKTT
jgi:hypothetical protein